MWIWIAVGFAVLAVIAAVAVWSGLKGRRRRRQAASEIECYVTRIPGPIEIVARWLREDFIDLYVRYSTVFVVVIFFLGIVGLAWGIVDIYRKLPEIAAGR